LRRWIFLDARCLNSCVHKRVFYTVGRHALLCIDLQTHEMRSVGVTEIDDLVTHHLVVGDIETNFVVRAEPRGTPVDLTHLGIGLAYLQPITEFVGPIELDRYTTDDPGEQILSSEANDDCNHAGSSKQSL